MTSSQGSPKSAAANGRKIQAETDARDRRRPEKQSAEKAIQAGERPYPKKFPSQHLAKPGREADLELKPMSDAPHYKGEGELWAEFYIKRELIWQKRRVRCKIVPRPFFAPERRKLTPPLDR